MPNGILVVCPSFKVLINIKAKADSFNLHFSKYIFFEQKQGDSLVEQFKIKALTEKGAVFFCVCRGKSSEGIDYPNELCRAVVIIGVPYPNIRDPMIN